MTNKELIEKLEMAQKLLSDVYHYACENGLDSVESAMSVADCAIYDSLVALSKPSEAPGKP